MTPEWYKNEIREITTKMLEIDLPAVLLEVAAEASATVEDVEEFVELFRKQEPELFNRIDRLFEEYGHDYRPYIFSAQAEAERCSDESVEFDPSEVSPTALATIFMLSDGMMDDGEVFEDYCDFIKFLRRDGQEQLAEYLAGDSMNDLEALLDFIHQEE